MISVLLIIVSIAKLSELVVRKGAYEKNNDFLEQSDDIDVLFLGTSHVINGVLPMELWKEYGITSYNLAGHAHSIPATYWVMMNALDHADPEIVVMDCFGLEREGKGGKTFIHTSFDNMPLSRNKVRAIFDIYDTTNERMEHLWNFSMYHTRWWHIGKDDFVPEKGFEKGAELKAEVAKVDTPASIDPSKMEKRKIDSTGVVYLKKIIEECRKRDIEVLLTCLPFVATEEQQIAASYAEEIAKQYDVGYINFLELDVINKETDYADASAHLNLSGAERVTDYLGGYLREHYGVVDHRQDERAKRWEEDYREYLAYKIRRISDLETLQNCLTALTDPNFSCCIYVGEDAGIWDSDDIYEALVRNLAFSQELSGLDRAVQSGESYLLVLDRERDNVLECVGAESLEKETSFGKVRYTADGSEVRKLWIGEGESDLLARQEEKEQIPAVTVVVINNLDHHVVYAGGFCDMYRVDRE